MNSPLGMETWRTKFSDEGMRHGKPSDEDESGSAGPIRAGKTAENRGTCIRVLAGQSFSRRIAGNGLASGLSRGTEKVGSRKSKENNLGVVFGGASMDIKNLLAQLHDERDAIDAAISSLEHLQDGRYGTPRHPPNLGAKAPGNGANNGHHTS